MGGSDRRFLDLLQDSAFAIAIGGAFLFSIYQVLQRADPDAGAKAEAKRKAKAATSRLQSIFSNHDREIEDDEEDDDGPDGGDRSSRRKKDGRPKARDLNLTPYEQTIAMEVVRPEEIPVTFDDIGGLDEVVDELRESVIYPLTLPHLYASHSSLLTAPSGVLLYGPPGCGKSMLAKALARESGACFINLHISTLTEKWYGDSNKLVSAVFSLARKLQPSIVFIDEIDAVLGQRRSGEHEASGMVKAEFMTHWDGLISATTDGGEQRICILGATNRAHDIDEAILRRMPKRFAVSLPSRNQRRQIFELTLKDTKIDWSKGRDGRRSFDMDILVRDSAGMSGSDIKDACRDAAMVPIREYMRLRRGKDIRGIDSDAVRGLQTGDFFRVAGGSGQQSGRGLASREEMTRLVEDTSDVDSHGSGTTEEVDDFADSREAEEVDARRR